ncbi:hypothetical protein KRR38_17075 [Novosphingobium sp. G106]|uniref:hypothetical protein n=1 Tax=Novosphingobium sp. G106 TaxID=2849500 RepID=UPI001C2D34EF|nr:hypothetical protein [Novosphingobium sp. G106]MBV1689337.1 hypothetical protein [Novosphingobium sp. G106]
MSNFTSDRSPDLGGMRLMLLISKSIIISLIIIVVISGDNESISNMMRNDLTLISAQIILLGLCILDFRKIDRELNLSIYQIILISSLIIVLAYAGHRLVLAGYNCVRDEQMADFDAFIYGHGHLAWPLPLAWQNDASALNLQFMLPVSKPVAWVSSYLPMNAGFRALAGSVADPALSGPIFAGLSFPMLWACGRRIWPDDNEKVVVALLLLACSGQVLMMGMTAYAMPAYLFFNLLWLWLFLNNRVRTDLAALLVGFVATGLHQPLFHPLFAVPFVFLLLIERRWPRLALFVFGYAIISTFWLAWPHIIHGLVTGPQSTTASGGVDYQSRLVGALSQNNRNVTLMAENILRFFAWQHILLLPLMLASAKTIRRDRLAGALAMGFVLPIIVMAVILPWQGFGFGYRYLHGVIGNAVLLGAYGWRHLAGLHDQLRPYLLRASAAGVFVILPMQAWLAHETYRPFAQLSEQVDASGVDYVIMGRTNLAEASSLVTNRPDLSNRPIRLYADDIGNVGAFAKRICHGRTLVALTTDSFFKPAALYFNVRPLPDSSSHSSALADLLKVNGCKVSSLR